MSGIQCPRCGREATGGGRFWRGGKPYCPACSWNVDRASALSSENQTLATVYFVGLAIFLAVIGASASSASQHRGNFIAFAFFLLLLALISWHRRKSRKRALTAAAPVPASGSAAFGTSPDSTPSYERLLMLSRPRAIRLKTWNRIFAAAYPIGFVAVVTAILVIVERGGAKANFSALPNVISFAMFGLIWAIMAARMFRSMLRDRILLSEGEIAVATVISQWFAGGESRNSRITYEFKDTAGRMFSGRCTDRTRKLFEEMQAPVFYDPVNPGKNVALAGATYEGVDS